ncbi:PQQ-binding-like beta-propeller repeat protein [bacterium]|nr:PQQ-binding-like beta-propeller repeat protein [bacterium]
MRHLNKWTVSLSVWTLAALFGGVTACHADDWPMWRHDAGRTAATSEALPESLELKWVRTLPPMTPAFHSERLQFDAGYEPVVSDGRLLLASSRTDSVTAYDAATGRELWTFRTNGPVRCAPAIWNGSVCFGSDDGCLYCAELATGGLRWKHRVVPSNRKLLGNQRLISVWPVRGGPVVTDGRVYFAAGVWPFEGVFVVALDVGTGDLIWRNERLGYLFGQQPHNTQAIGGLAPQGYLIVNGDELIVPCSTAYPAKLNRATGELIEFDLPSPGRFPGGWFAAIDADSARAIRRGKLTFDDVVNRQQHEDKLNKGDGVSGISRILRAGDRTLKFDDGFNGVEGTIHSMIVAERRLFVSTRAGQIYCFGEADNSQPAQRRTPRNWERSHAALVASDEATERARRLIRHADAPQGYALVVGLSDGELAKALLQESQFQLVAFDDDASRVERLRQELELAGLAGRRAAVVECDLQTLTLPPYLATVIATERPPRISDLWNPLLQTLRPFGSVAATGMPPGTESVTGDQLKSLSPGSFELSVVDSEILIRRVGPLPGSSDYQGEYALCEDELVRFPLGVLWFDDTLAHFKRSPQPLFRDGVMISRPKDWHAPRIKGNYSVDYPLLPPVLSDIYTGRVLAESEQVELRKSLPKSDGSPQISYYHAPHQKTALNPDPPVAGERVNPLTGQKEVRAFPKTYGCDGGVDYGAFYTLRSGTAAFYDKTLESGTVFISGPRSGCTNSIIPSGGLLNVPYFYEGCTCSYPLPTALSLVAMPADFEQWSAWGEDRIQPGTIQRIGLNFGAPGDRMTREGTLWLDYPSVGGPSPQIHVTTVPEKPAARYRHSLWMQEGAGWPWVSASCLEGLQKLTLSDLKPGLYTVKLVFAEPNDFKVGDRVQTISLQGRAVLSDFDVLAQTQRPLTGIVRQIDNVAIDGNFALTLKATAGQTLISGVEIIRVNGTSTGE